MAMYKMTETEEKFAELIWQHEPLSSGELVELAFAELNWKKSTMYTVLKKLCMQGLFQNVDSEVSALVTRDEYNAGHGIQFVEDTYGGSLPKFVAAFVRKKKLTSAQFKELKRLIDEIQEE